MSNNITASHVSLNDQLVDILIKSLQGPQINYIYNMFSACDLYTPVWKGVLKYLL